MDVEKFKMGWLVVAFDLPVMSKPQRKAATAFRDFLLDDGFQMMQFSVYVRPCVSFARQETHIDRIKKSIPPEGKVRAFFVTRARIADLASSRGRRKRAGSDAAPLLREAIDPPLLG